MKRATPVKTKEHNRINEARRALLEKRSELLGRRRALVNDEGELLETQEPDWEDVAANKTAADALGHLSELELRQLKRITAALERIQAGSYGACGVCKEPIPEARLRVMPEAPTCASCANAHN